MNKNNKEVAKKQNKNKKKNNNNNEPTNLVLNSNVFDQTFIRLQPSLFIHM